jgi:hypothetical protein
MRPYKAGKTASVDASANSRSQSQRGVLRARRSAVKTEARAKEPVKKIFHTANYEITVETRLGDGGAYVYAERIYWLARLCMNGVTSRGRDAGVDFDGVSSEGRHDISFLEIVPFKKHGLTIVLRQRISETITVIQPGRVTAIAKSWRA